MPKLLRAPAEPTDAKVAEAERALVTRLMAHQFKRLKTLKYPDDKDAVNVMSRERIEIQEMLVRVRREANETNRGWTWHLLSVLDWDGHDVRKNEQEGVRVRLLDSPQERAAALQREREQAGRTARLRRALVAFDAVQADLAWMTSQYRGEARSHLEYNVAAARGVLALAHDDSQRLDRAIASIESIHGHTRRSEHVRAAAMRMLIELHGLSGKTEKAELARFIEAENDRLRPHPCPSFAADETSSNVRKILSRSGL